MAPNTLSLMYMSVDRSTYIGLDLVTKDPLGMIIIQKF